MGYLHGGSTPAAESPTRSQLGDADVLIAWALLRDSGPNSQEHNAAGRQITDAVLRQEMIFTAAGHAALATGPWAVGSRSVNIS